jgi:anhydro-N-acetylmuramic acid kinase
MVPTTSSELFIGLMSGTSLDGVDGALVAFKSSANSNGLQHAMAVISHSHCPLPVLLRKELLSLNVPHGSNELHRSAVLAQQLAPLYAQVVHQLLAQSGTNAANIVAIGSHGQTVRHHPSPAHADKPHYTVQINHPALLAELTQIDVIADFRSADMAAGGQGAPLVPAFHQAFFPAQPHTQIILNLGGISNLTALYPQQTHPQYPVLGFDCGPANALMDEWCQQHTGQLFDRDGAWAASGCVSKQLLQRLLAEPYFRKPPPKSTGRDLFNAHWLARHLAALNSPAQAQDVQATLCELTTISCAQDIQAYAPQTRKVFVCGGGALNTHLMARLQHHLPKQQVQRTDALGLPAMQVEAAAFAWLAHAHVHRLPGNLVSVTGATAPRVLGALYPASTSTHLN